MLLIAVIVIGAAALYAAALMDADIARNLQVSQNRGETVRAERILSEYYRQFPDYRKFVLSGDSEVPVLSNLASVGTGLDLRVVASNPKWAADGTVFRNLIVYQNAADDGRDDFDESPPIAVISGEPIQREKLAEVRRQLRQLAAKFEKFHQGRARAASGGRGSVDGNYYQQEICPSGLANAMMPCASSPAPVGDVGFATNLDATNPYGLSITFQNAGDAALAATLSVDLDAADQPIGVVIRSETPWGSEFAVAEKLL